MKPNDLAICLRDLSDTLNVCGNDYSDILYAAATQLEQRLLTDAEREAIETSFDSLQYAADELGLGQGDCDRLAATLRGLLERMQNST